jgi:GGDEF domain-containing protein
VSFGIARWPQHRANSAALIQAADRATDRGKHSDDAQAVMAASRPAASAG